MTDRRKPENAELEYVDYDAEVEAAEAWLEAQTAARTDLDLPAHPYQGVYFVRCDAFIKIGIAVNVRIRLKGLRASNPFPVEPLGWIPTPDALALERRLHQQFAPQRHRHEWFYDHDALRAYIATEAQPWPEAHGTT